MGLEDLTPQLRTRLGRVERLAGLFVGLSAILLLFGFGVYLYQAGVRKGWFVTQVTYYTYVDSAAGFKVGDPVKLMGFDAGEITRILPSKPEDRYNVYVEFKIKSPNYGYIWSPDSHVIVNSGDFLGHRYLEVTKGGSPFSTNLQYRATFREEMRNGKPVVTGMWVLGENHYAPFTRDSKYWLSSDESPAVTERLDAIAKQVEEALPNILSLTNRLASILNNGAEAATNLNSITTSMRPIAENLSEITTQLRDTNGSLGRWLVSTNFGPQLDKTMASANSMLSDVDTNLSTLLEKLAFSLDNLAGITSNLNSQVQVNTNILTSISDAVVHTDQLIQGLKRHWLLRSAFKETPTNRPPAKVTPPMGSKR
ncbi:MAG TPA: MlaD family protein [Candidatus Nitrosotalea sp.]|nr:MlaD family protein [Candidatus Nitrosotalea sp.]